MKKVLCCLRYEATVVSYHAQEPLKLFDGCWGRRGSNGFDSVRKRFDAGVVDMITEELQAGDAQDAFGSLDHKAVG